MAQTTTTPPNSGGEGNESKEAVARLLASHYEADRHLRRGLCLLNAGRFGEAGKEFTQAAHHGGTDESLASRLAACLIGEGRFTEAAEQFAHEAEQRDGSPVALIRRALTLSASGRPNDAIDLLREAIRNQPECAELHFQLGTLLTTMDQYEEAELRFAQTLSIDRSHAEAMVSLALCCGLPGRAGAEKSLSVLQRAQRLKPHDPRIAMLLAQAAQAQQREGRSPHLSTNMPGEALDTDPAGIDQLARAIEAEPDFVDAILSIPEPEVDRQIYSMLLSTLRVALDRQPEHAELRFHCGRVLDRLGRRDDAIVESEAAVRINPGYTRALIELAKLYKQTDRSADAASRLEQAIRSGAEYADVYVLLGDLYQEQGETGRARKAYQRALCINERYEAAHLRLASLSI